MKQHEKHEIENVESVFNYSILLQLVVIITLFRLRCVTLSAEPPVFWF